MEHNDVAMWACLKALDLRVSKSDWDDEFVASVYLWNDGGKISGNGNTVYKAARALYDKIINLNVDEL